jgi:BlaI family transcriptional regulator, penicillinase repressor
MSASGQTAHLSRRERQIMDILYRQGKATAAAVRNALPDQPSYSAVRALLRILEAKGHVRHETEGLRYVYAPSVARDRAKRSALRHLLHTFFDGSASQVMVSAIRPRSMRSRRQLSTTRALTSGVRPRVVLDSLPPAAEAAAGVSPPTS